LKMAFADLLARGTQFRSPGFFTDVLDNHELKTAKKDTNIAGLQVADIIAYPSKEDVLAELGRIQIFSGKFVDELRKAMRKHYNRQAYNGRIRGYGMVLL